MSWTDQNEIMRFAKQMLDATGSSTPSENSMISQLASGTGVAYNVARDAYVKSILDPLLQERVRKSMGWLINANFIPEFVNSQSMKADLDESTESFDPSALRPDGIEIPKHMFNLKTDKLDDRIDQASAQYVILSHSWKGQEITYGFISKIRENQKKKELYQMIQDDPDEDEEARRFARFQVKKYQHLEAGKTDLELLRIQCNMDVQAQVKKIEMVRARSGIKASPRELLAQLTGLKAASFKESEARKAKDKKNSELKSREKAYAALKEEKEKVAVDDSETQGEIDSMNKLEKELLRVNGELTEALFQLKQAEEETERATSNCSILNQDPNLRSAVEDLLPILERMKSVNKIEKSISEAKKILKLGLFPSRGRKNQYLWNDTCCINKADANELTESLAMMGQWYNNADFCLVHLDTPEWTEWLSTWDMPEKLPEPNFKSFDMIESPKWATRGWTLQELVLSKMAFYVNNLWQPLSRGAEGLGPYYYHHSYLKQHIVDTNIFGLPATAKSKIEDISELRKLTDQIPYIEYEGCSEKSRRLIGILDYLKVFFPGDMDNNNAGAHIRNTINKAVIDIDTLLNGKNKETPEAQRLRALFTALGFDMSVKTTKSCARNLIKLLVGALVKNSAGDIRKDREKVFSWSKVPALECCRGLQKPSIPAHDIMSLASYRECTVPIDRVYSLMGVLGVKFAAFQAEGSIKALCRLLDEVLIATNDVSIFNWAGKDLGSPIRGRSLYPLDLTAYSPEDTESGLAIRNHDLLARDSRAKRYGLQDTASRLTLLLRRTIEFVESPAQKDVPIDLIQTLLAFIQETPLKKLRPQLVNLGKLLVYLENTPSYEEYKPKTRSWSTRTVVSDDKKAQGNFASRFGINTPQVPQMPKMPQMPQLPQFSAPKLKVGGLGGFYGKKGAAKEPEPVKETPIAAPPIQPPVPIVQEQAEPATLVGEVTDWISEKNDVENVPVEFQKLFAKIPVPKVLEGYEQKEQKVEEKQKEEEVEEEVDTTPSTDSMICPNPIMLTTSGIEGVFDIQRVIITMEDAEILRGQVEISANESQKISGKCTISTALSRITVSFSCAAGDLQKQLDVCDVVRQALSDDETEKEKEDSTKTETAPAQPGEGNSYYSKLSSLSSGFMRKGPETPVPTENEDSKKETPDEKVQPEDPKQDTPDEKTPVKPFGKTQEQRRVSRMLEFIQETNINLIVGEWVLARFTGAEGAKWFLCQLELGSTHNYYGRRIATDDIDFKAVVPEPGLVGHWEDYMQNKKAKLCEIVDVLVKGRDAKRYAEEVAGPEKEKEKDAQIKGEDDENSDDESPDPKDKIERLVNTLVKRGTHIGAEIAQKAAVRWGKRLDGVLSDTILQQVPKELRSAILNLNENKDLLPAMFLNGIKVHMF
ncbi:hypothetical protein L207DRAFT_471987 [Hyaloscypha variabilis F]|uniref:Heterokaryon incompatibility domain-containing protein n=1 Tax=Hyaloscypha variabilis (strain UAMH 11265 / GT02V1 / F) TaxID=1149755 RepID=A0A2J6R094_HYAVF|nr:hypothetical protein L207DRAFT_471987 [Hyaloscypha variabilis F]